MSACHCSKETKYISFFRFGPQCLVNLQIRGRCLENSITSKIEVWMLDLSKLLSRLYDSQLATHRKHDFLPPFSTLTNDEDREKKAAFRPPGNYNVIVTPSSFAGSEEYKANQDGDKTPVTGGSKSSKQSSTDFLCEDLEANVITFKDPDTVMLRVFEDNTKKLSSPSSPSSRFGLSSASSITSPSSGHRFQCMDMFTPPPLTFEIKPQDNRDWPLICHYRNILSRHLFHVHRGSITPALAPDAFFTQELFERTVATFRPLYHALMALCALGIAHRSGIQNLDSLQHYQQALPCLQKTLRSPEDLSSDGALLTHFILLLYEIAAAAPRSSNLWSQHINQLLRIFVLRSEMYETEPYSFLLWWVCNIDTHALVCGTSDGELVDAMLQYNMFPTADNIVQLNGTGECYDPATEEANAMPAVLSFNRKIEILTCRLGLLRRNLQREAESLARRGIKMSKSDLLERQRRVTDIQNALRRTWADQMPPSMVTAIRDNTLPTRAKGIFDNAYVLYRACIIYSHTSMYPTQRHASSLYMIPTTTSLAAHLTSRQYNPSAPLHPGNHYNPPINPMEAEISLSAHEILHLTRSIIGSGHHELRFAVFPLFMAGFVLPVQERGLALNLMEGMEMESIGRNTRATRELLEDVFERSDRGEGMGAKGASGVDWIRVLGERGLQLI
ncbi:MAG: hypothetical protein Q9188_000296 [Gyalolechia gomerana]